VTGYQPACSLGEPCHEASCGACYPVAVGRVLITGSRTWDDVPVVEEALRPHFRPGAVLVSGACPKGADAICERVWEGWGGLVERHPADWEGPCRDTCKPGHRKPDRQGGTYCPAAGNYRDAEMVAEGAEAAEAFIHAGSHGASTTAELAERAGIPVNRHEITSSEAAPRQQWSRCPGDGRPIHPGDQRAIADFRRHLERSPAERLDYDAGVAMRAGDLDRAVRLIYQARQLDPARSALWESRQERLLQAMAATTERRLKDAGIEHDDPGLQNVRNWNAALSTGTEAGS
jgi:YspA, cpYpsA-related SLOG family